MDVLVFSHCRGGRNARNPFWLHVASQVHKRVAVGMAF